MPSKTDIRRCTVTRGKHSYEIIVTADGSFFDFYGDPEILPSPRVQEQIATIPTALRNDWIVIEH
jgi:hypothetical protein